MRKNAIKVDQMLKITKNHIENLRYESFYVKTLNFGPSPNTFN
jgi:hypothetical protein